MRYARKRLVGIGQPVPGGIENVRAAQFAGDKSQAYLVEVIVGGELQKREFGTGYQRALGNADEGIRGKGRAADAEADVVSPVRRRLASDHQAVGARLRTEQAQLVGEGLAVRKAGVLELSGPRTFEQLGEESAACSVDLEGRCVAQARHAGTVRPESGQTARGPAERWEIVGGLQARTERKK